VEAWYAIRVRSNQEKHVAASLAGKGLECFLPSYHKVSRWTDRVKKIELPLFAGYVFSRFDAARRLPVLSTPGVFQILGNVNGPLPVDEAELEAIRRLTTSGRPVLPWPDLQAGDAVVVEHGPLAGARGILLRVKDECRLVASLTLLQRSVAVELNCDAVRPESARPLRRPPMPDRTFSSL
jgi:transcription antitermination factor NusG